MRECTAACDTDHVYCWHEPSSLRPLAHLYFHILWRSLLGVMAQLLTNRLATGLWHASASEEQHPSTVAVAGGRHSWGYKGKRSTHR